MYAPPSYNLWLAVTSWEEAHREIEIEIGRKILEWATCQSRDESKSRDGASFQYTQVIAGVLQHKLGSVG